MRRGFNVIITTTRGVRSLNATNFRSPWPFVKKGAFGQRKIGPFNYEKFKWPGQEREFPELSPKWKTLNPTELHRYTGVQPDGYSDPETGKHVSVPEMKTELVVPNLDGFKLSPYVSYRTDVQIEKRRLAYEAKAQLFKQTMLRMFSKCPFSTSVNHLKMVSDTRLIYTVDLLREKSSGYLKESDTAQACEKSFQACKLALMNYVKRLETTSDIKIVPENSDNPWNYKIFSKLCFLIRKKVEPDVAEKINNGWSTAFVFHVKGWTQNDLSVEEVQSTMPFVSRFLDIVEKDLIVDREMAMYVKKRLFVLDLDELAFEINTESKKGKVGLLLQNFNLRKDRRKKLDDLYQKKYAESLADVLLKNKNGVNQFFRGR